jgi:imidazoleglycerol phosphate synthase glutamine amidotransferase subunit HisH
VNEETQSESSEFEDDFIEAFEEIKTRKKRITNSNIKLPDMLWDLFNQFKSTTMLTATLREDTNETK